MLQAPAGDTCLRLAPQLVDSAPLAAA
jgi:hypothetical protein